MGGGTMRAPADADVAAELALWIMNTERLYSGPWQRWADRQAERWRAGRFTVDSAARAALRVVGAAVADYPAEYRDVADVRRWANMATRHAAALSLAEDLADVLRTNGGEL